MFGLKKQNEWVLRNMEEGEAKITWDTVLSSREEHIIHRNRTFRRGLEDSGTHTELEMPLGPLGGARC